MAWSHSASWLVVPRHIAGSGSVYAPAQEKKTEQIRHKQKSADIIDL